MDFYRLMVLFYIFERLYLYMCLCVGMYMLMSALWRSDDVRTHGTGLSHCEPSNVDAAS